MNEALTDEFNKIFSTVADKKNEKTKDISLERGIYLPAFFPRHHT
jgi:hypothetical protein